jgi:hypothetical protein
MAYHAFYLEIIKSRFISQELSVCKTRLSFWDDNLKKLIKKDSNIKEPISLTLRDTFEKTNIRKETLFRMIDYQVTISIIILYIILYSFMI